MADLTLAAIMKGLSNYTSIFIGRNTMTDNQIKQLAIKFRKAIEIAHQKGLFSHDIALDDFPTGNCGDVSYLLAE